MGSNLWIFAENRQGALFLGAGPCLGGGLGALHQFSAQAGGWVGCGNLTALAPILGNHPGFEGTVPSRGPNRRPGVGPHTVTCPITSLAKSCSAMDRTQMPWTKFRLWWFTWAGGSETSGRNGPEMTPCSAQRLVCSNADALLHQHCTDADGHLHLYIRCR